MTTPFAQYVDGMMGERPLLNQPLQLVGFFLMTYFASHTDGTVMAEIAIPSSKPIVTLFH